jgi:hypothetical protein
LPGILKDKPQPNFDLFKPEDYLEALKEKLPRPFIFGPIDFHDLDQEPFDLEYWYD